jgi:hypothetical protein
MHGLRNMSRLYCVQVQPLQGVLHEQILLQYSLASRQSIRSDVGEWLRTLLPCAPASAELYPFDPLTYLFLTGWLAVLLSNRFSSPLVLLRIRPGRFWFSF